ncbi:hypothetical protein B484DRAFT_459677, partial [Ochromonadaceae sp. CCMP2298]
MAKSLSAMGKSLDTLFRSALGNRSSVLFGEECGSVALWTIFALILRSVLVFLEIEIYIPTAFLFAFPFVIQYLGQALPVLQDRYPILQVRIAEAIMGRLPPAQIMLVIPAHFVGSIIGTVAFRIVCPSAFALSLAPIAGNEGILSGAVLVETLAVFVYVCAVIVLPELIAVNRLNSRLLSLLLVPVMFASSGGAWCPLNPAMSYALWYASRHITSSGLGSAMPVGHIIAPICGAVAAGLFCNYFFPDNSSCWQRGAVRF